jgi:multidrug resistance efflux pump
VSASSSRSELNVMQRGSMQPSPRIEPMLASDPRWRENVEAAFDAGVPIIEALRVAPASTWIGVVLIGLVVASAFLFAFFGPIEVTARGPGALRAAQGSVSALAETSGPVLKVLVHSGERVSAGQVLLQIDATAMEATLQESERRLQFLSTQAQVASTHLDALTAERREQLQARVALLQSRVANQAQSVARFEQRLRDFEQLRARGFVSAHARDDTAEKLDEARRQQLAIGEELSQTRAQLAELTAQRESERLRLDEDRVSALARRDAARTVLRQSIVTAPRAGVVESIVVRSGEVVQPGTTVAKIVPDAAPTHVVAFVSERDRAFLTPGAAARLELQQLPVGEFGSLHGTVARIGADLATSGELQDALGEGHDVKGPHYRVEIELEPDAQYRKLASFLRVGVRADVRFTLRERRIITLILEPLRKWLQ